MCRIRKLVFGIISFLETCWSLLYYFRRRTEGFDFIEAYWGVFYLYIERREARGYIDKYFIIPSIGIYHTYGPGRVFASFSFRFDWLNKTSILTIDCNESVPFEIGVNGNDFVERGPG